MPDDVTGLAMIAGLIFLVAGTVKGTVGIGLPTVSVGLMTQFIAPHTAVALVVFPIIVSNAWQVFRTGIDMAALRRYGVVSVCLVVTLFAFTFVAASISPMQLLGIIGVAIFLFSATSLVKMPPELPDRYDRTGQVVAGVSAGVLGGLTGLWAPPLVVYLMARRTEKDEFVRAVGLLLMLGGLPLALGFWQSGMLNGETAPLSALMIVPTLIGFTVGEVIRRRLDAERFRKAILWMFLLMGLNLMRRALF